MDNLFLEKIGFRLYNVPRYFLSRIHVLLRIPTLYFVLGTWYICLGTWYTHYFSNNFWKLIFLRFKPVGNFAISSS